MLTKSTVKATVFPAVLENPEIHIPKHLHYRPLEDFEIFRAGFVPPFTDGNEEFEDVQFVRESGNLFGRLRFDEKKIPKAVIDEKMKAKIKQVKDEKKVEKLSRQERLAIEEEVKEGLAKKYDPVPEWVDFAFVDHGNTTYLIIGHTSPAKTDAVIEFLKLTEIGTVSPVTAAHIVTRALDVPTDKVSFFLHYPAAFLTEVARHSLDKGNWESVAADSPAKYLLLGDSITLEKEDGSPSKVSASGGFSANVDEVIHLIKDGYRVKKMALEVGQKEDTQIVGVEPNFLALSSVKCPKLLEPADAASVAVSEVLSVYLSIMRNMIKYSRNLWEVEQELYAEKGFYMKDHVTNVTKKEDGSTVIDMEVS